MTRHASQPVVRSGIVGSTVFPRADCRKTAPPTPARGTSTSDLFQGRSEGEQLAVGPDGSVDVDCPPLGRACVAISEALQEGLRLPWRRLRVCRTRRAAAREGGRAHGPLTGEAVRPAGSRGGQQLRQGHGRPGVAAEKCPALRSEVEGLLQVVAAQQARYRGTCRGGGPFRSALPPVLPVFRAGRAACRSGCAAAAAPMCPVPRAVRGRCGRPPVSAAG